MYMTIGGQLAKPVRIRAGDLTRRGLWEALQARRTYALTGARIALTFKVNGACMGAELPPAERAGIEVEAWAPSQIKTIEILKNTQVIKVFEPADDHAVCELSDPAGGGTFYHCRVTQADGHLAVCSPVWLG